MKRRATLWLLIAALAFAPAAFSQPRRIVSTAPSITEMLYALGLGDRVAGVTRYCRFPPEAQLKPKIGGYTDPNLEAIAALKPDLVIITTNPVHLAQQLGALHLHVLEITQDSLAALYNSIRVVGDATGTQVRATQLIGSIRSGLDRIHKSVAGLRRTRMMFVLGRSSNRLDGLVVVGKASYLNDVIDVAGGENVFHDALAPYPMVPLEEVIARNPDVILDMGDMSEGGGVSEEYKRNVLSLWQREPVIAAVRNHRVFPIAGDFYTIPGPRIVNAARAIGEMLHPAAR